MTINSQLMLDTMDYIDAHPHEHSQRGWSRCYFGTANKVAGVRDHGYGLLQPDQGYELLGLEVDTFPKLLEATRLWDAKIDRDELRCRVYAYIKRHDPDFYNEHVVHHGRFGSAYKVFDARAKRGDFKQVTDLTVEQVLADRPERELQTTTS